MAFDFYVKFGSNAADFIAQLQADRAKINEEIVGINRDLSKHAKPGKVVTPPSGAPGSPAADPAAARPAVAKATTGGIDMSHVTNEMGKAAQAMREFSAGLTPLISSMTAVIEGLKKSAGLTSTIDEGVNRSNAARTRDEKSPRGRDAGGRFAKPENVVIRPAAPSAPAAPPPPPRAADVPKAIIDAATFTRLTAGIDKTAENTHAMLGKLDTIAAKLQAIANTPVRVVGGGKEEGGSGSGTRGSSKGKVVGDKLVFADDEYTEVSRLREKIRKTNRLSALSMELDRAKSNKDRPANAQEPPDERTLEVASQGTKRFRQKGLTTGYAGDHYIDYIQKAILATKKMLANAPELHELQRQLDEAITRTGTADGHRPEEQLRARREAITAHKAAQRKAGVTPAAKETKKPETRDEKNARLDVEIARLDSEIVRISDEITAEITGSQADMKKIGTLSAEIAALQKQLERNKYKREGTRQEHKAARRATAQAEREADPRLVDSTDATNRLGLMRQVAATDFKKQHLAQMQRMAKEYEAQGYPVRDDQGHPVTTKTRKPQMIAALQQAYGDFQSTGELTMQDLTKWQRRPKDGVEPEAEYVPPRVRRMTGVIAQNVERSFEHHEAATAWRDKGMGWSGIDRPMDLHLDALQRERLSNDYKRVRNVASEEGKRQFGENPSYNPYDPEIRDSIKGHGQESDAAHKALSALQSAATRLDLIVKHAAEAESKLARWTANLERVDTLRNKIFAIEEKGKQAPKGMHDDLAKAEAQVERDNRMRNLADPHTGLTTEQALRTFYDKNPELGSMHPDVVGPGLKAREEARTILDQKRAERSNEPSNQELMRQTFDETFFGRQTAMGAGSGTTGGKGGKKGRVKRTETISLMDSMDDPSFLQEKFGSIDAEKLDQARKLRDRARKTYQKMGREALKGAPEEEVAALDKKFRDHMTNMFNRFEQALGMEPMTLPTANKMGWDDHGRRVVLERSMSMASIEGKKAEVDAAAKAKIDVATGPIYSPKTGWRTPVMKTRQKQRLDEMRDLDTARKHLRDPSTITLEELEAAAREPSRAHGERGMHLTYEPDPEKIKKAALVTGERLAKQTMPLRVMDTEFGVQTPSDLKAFHAQGQGVLGDWQKETLAAKDAMVRHREELNAANAVLHARNTAENQFKAGAGDDAKERERRRLATVQARRAERDEAHAAGRLSIDERVTAAAASLAAAEERLAESTKRTTQVRETLGRVEKAMSSPQRPETQSEIDKRLGSQWQALHGDATLLERVQDSAHAPNIAKARTQMLAAERRLRSAEQAVKIAEEGGAGADRFGELERIRDQRKGTLQEKRGTYLRSFAENIGPKHVEAYLQDEGAQAVERVRGVLQHAGVRWSSVLNESLTTAGSIGELHAKLQKLIKAQTLMITPDIDVREGKEGHGKDSYQLGSGPGGAAGTRQTQSMLREEDILHDPVAPGKPVKPIGTVHQVFDADQIAKDARAAKRTAADEAIAARAARTVGATGIADECCERIVAAINRVESTLRGTLRVSGTVGTRGKATEEEVAATTSEGVANKRGKRVRPPTSIDRNATLADRNVPDNLVAQANNATTAEQRLAAAVALVTGKFANQREAKQMFAKDMQAAKEDAQDWADKLRSAVAQKEALAKSSGGPLGRTEVKDFHDEIKAKQLIQTQADVNRTLGASNSAARKYHDTLRQLAADYNTLRESGTASEETLKAHRKQMTDAKVATYASAFEQRRLQSPNETMPETRKAVSNVLTSAMGGVKLPDNELKSLGHLTEASVVRGIEERATGMGSNGNALVVSLFGGQGFMARALHTTGTFLVRNFSAGLVFGVTNVFQDAIKQAIETESTFVRVSDALSTTGRSTSGVRTSLQGLSQQYGVSLREVYTTAAGLTGLFNDNKMLVDVTKIAVQLHIISGGALNATEAMKSLSGITSAFAESTPKQIADIATVIQNRLSVNIEESIEGVARLSGQAVELGLGLEQTMTYVAAISKFTNTTGAGAGEQFSRILAQLTTGKGSSAVISGLQSVGVDVSGAFQQRDYQTILQKLLEIYPRLSKAEQNHIAVALGGQRQAAAINGLLREGVKINETVIAARNSSGAADRRAAAISRTFANELKRLNDSFVVLVANIGRTGFGNPLGLALMGLNKLLQTTNSLFGAFNDALDANNFTKWSKLIITGMLGIAATAMIVRKSIGALFGAVGMVAPRSAERLKSSALAGAMGVGGRQAGVSMAEQRAMGRAALAESFVATFGGKPGFQGPKTRTRDEVTASRYYRSAAYAEMVAHAQENGETLAPTMFAGRNIDPVTGIPTTRRGRYFARKSIQTEEKAANLGAFGRKIAAEEGLAAKGVGTGVKAAGAGLGAVSSGLAGLAGASLPVTAAIIGVVGAFGALVGELHRGKEAADAYKQAYNAYFGKDAKRKADGGVPPVEDQFRQNLDENRKTLGWGTWGGFKRNLWNDMKSTSSFGGPFHRQTRDQMHGFLPDDQKKMISNSLSRSVEFITQDAKGLPEIQGALKGGMDDLQILAEKINKSSDSKEQKDRAMHAILQGRARLQESAQAAILASEGMNKLSMMTQDQLNAIGGLLGSVAGFGPMVLNRYSALIASQIKAMGFLQGSPILDTLTSLTPHGIESLTLPKAPAALKNGADFLGSLIGATGPGGAVAKPDGGLAGFMDQGIDQSQADHDALAAKIRKNLKPFEGNTAARRADLVKGLTEAADAAQADALAYGDSVSEDANKARQTAFSLLGQLDQALTSQLQGGIQDAQAYANLAIGRGDVSGAQQVLSGAIQQLRARREAMTKDDIARAVLDQQIQDMKKSITDAQIESMNAPLELAASKTFNRSEQLRLKTQEDQNRLAMYQSNDPVIKGNLAKAAKQAEEESPAGQAKKAAAVTTASSKTFGANVASAGATFKTNVASAGASLMALLSGKPDPNAPKDPVTPPGSPNSTGRDVYRGKTGTWGIEVDDNGRKRRVFTADKAQPTAHLDKTFAAHLTSLINDAPGTVGITSGYRTYADQKAKWEQALKKYGSAAEARKHVAPPGKSNHNRGLAVDLNFDSPATKKWVHNNAAKYGLNFPMSYEDWHIEPTGIRGKKTAGPGYVTGVAPKTDTKNSTSGASNKDKNDAQKTVNEDAQQAIQIAIEERQAAQQTALAKMAPLDTEGMARKQLQYAQENQQTALMYGKTSTQYQSATQEVIRAQRAIHDAQDSIFNSQSNLSLTISDAAGNTLNSARIRVVQAKNVLKQAKARSGGKNTAEVMNARAGVVSAEQAQKDAIRNDAIGTIDFNLQMGKISQQAAIQSLQHILDTTAMSRDARRELELKIKGLKDSMAGGQWNIGDIKLPTVYEMRKSLMGESGMTKAAALMRDGATVSGNEFGGGGATSGGAGTTTISLTINGGDLNAVKSVLAQYLGPVALGTTSISTTKV